MNNDRIVRNRIEKISVDPSTVFGIFCLYYFHPKFPSIHSFNSSPNQPPPPSIWPPHLLSTKFSDAPAGPAPRSTAHAWPYSGAACARVS